MAGGEGLFVRKISPSSEQFVTGRVLSSVRFFPVFTTASERTPARASSLVERLAAGEAESVGEAYDRHHRRVRAFCRNLLRDDAAVEDLVQETFLTLPRAARRFRGDSSLETFVISIAINRARHHVRAAARRRRAHERFGDQRETPRPRTPEDERSRRELGDALARALDQLPLDQRVAFVLCAVEERNAREAAEIVGVPHGTMRTRLFHARGKLKALLSAEGFE